MKKYLLVLFIALFFNVTFFAQTIFTSSNLPILVIDTKGRAIPDEPKIEATMGVIDNGPGKRNNITDPFNGYNGKIGIEIRGQSTTQFPKKQYGVETRDETGNDIKVSLLGLPAESDWVLNANYLDKTFMRNILAYKLYNNLGRYATRTKFCEVVLNNEYVGLYILQEKIKRDKNRVDISKLEPTDITGDDLTGGYIVRIDKTEPADQYWTSPFVPYSGTFARIRYQYYYPDKIDITAEQKKYISEYVTAFESITNSSTYNDPFANYLNYIDIDSFVDTFILNEFTKATDAYRISAYFYKDRTSKGGKLVAGPPWDFDISFGVANYDQGFDSYGWQLFYKNGTQNENPFWCGKLFNDPIFKNKFIKRWSELKNTILSSGIIDKYIDDTLLEINEAVTRNFNKWKILGVYVWPNKNTFKTFDEEIAYLKSWIKQRISWFNTQLPSIYSSAEWYERDLSSLDFKVGYPQYFPKSYFVKSSQNITSIDFYCLDTNVTIKLESDSLAITVLKSGNYLIKGVTKNGASTISISPDYKINVGTEVETVRIFPSMFQLCQNYPNPFNPSTSISYHLPVASYVLLKVYDILGREVASLINGFLPAGSYNYHWHILNEELVSGIYFCKITAGDPSSSSGHVFTDVKKMLYVK
jgi:hypothetical protein